jgi:mannose-1-phosphate guanylyltransferase/mannose-6-phosphate isomerase
MHRAIDAAADGAIVTLGIVPNRPETGYGYIRVRSNQNAANAAQRVAQFVEKPDAQTAQAYLDAGDYFWNAGMFVVRASVWLQAIQQFREDILSATQRAWRGRRIDTQFVRPDAEAFAAIPSESIDYAVMEHAPAAGLEVKMVALDAGWSDLGAWDAVWEVLPKDAAGNAQFGDVMLSNTRNTMVHASDRLVAVVGTDDLVVIETADAVLVASQRNSQEVKHIVQALEAATREEHSLHRKVHRPWGWYDSIDVGERFKVKRIQVKPGASLSLQKHQHRAEHWVVVRGEAEITCGERTERLQENQSTYIPQGAVHRLANPGKIPLEIIEVQSGAYLGEDDIERLADDYGRGTN